MPATVESQPLILNLAPTGVVPTRALSPHVPLGVSEIVRDVLACAGRGVTIVHLHARDERGEPTSSKEVYARIIGGIRSQRPDLVLCVSCSGRRAPELERRAEVLELEGDLKPDLASLTLSSLNFAREASLNPPDVVVELARRMRDRGILPEFELFDPGMVNALGYLQARGLAEPPFYANLMLGSVFSSQVGFLDIGALVARLPADTCWALGGIGYAQLPLTAMAVAAAPGARVGLEDYLWLDAARSRPATNLEYVDRVHRLCALSDRAVMTPSAFRARFKLPAR